MNIPRTVAGRFIASPKRKYRNSPTLALGLKFPSKRQARRYEQLRLLEKGGRVRGLLNDVQHKAQLTYRCEVNGLLICKYIADFQYEELIDGAWVRVTEDSKGFKTPAYVLKRKLMRACHGIELRET